MKLYRSLTTRLYHEKQADVPKGEKFEAVEFPFAASPKADFVAWMNQQPASERACRETAPLLEEMDWTPKQQPLPTQPDPAHAARSIALEDAWENLPFAQKAHFASLFCEEAREKLR